MAPVSAVARIGFCATRAEAAPVTVMPRRQRSTSTVFAEASSPADSSALRAITGIIVLSWNWPWLLPNVTTASRIDAGADGGAAERQLAQCLERLLDAHVPQLAVVRVAAEYLADPDRHRVHQVRAARNHLLPVRVGQLVERVREKAQRRPQL